MELPDNVSKRTGDQIVYEFNILVDGKDVNSFDGEKPLRISLDYKPAAGENPNNIVVYNVEDNGAVKIVRTGKYDSSTGKVSFTVKQLGQYTVVYEKVSFSDLDTVLWAKESIEALAARQVIDGRGDGKFAPHANVTRAEFIKILMNAFDLVDDTAKCDLKDVKEGTWYFKSVASAQKLGIIQGYEDGSFGVDRLITREEMSAISYRAALAVKINLDSIEKKVQFLDQQKIAQYAKEAVEVLQKAGVIDGIDDMHFAPGETASRAQAAKVIFYMFKKIK